MILTTVVMALFWFALSCLHPRPAESFEGVRIPPGALLVDLDWKAGLVDVKRFGYLVVGGSFERSVRLRLEPVPVQAGRRWRVAAFDQHCENIVNAEQQSYSDRRESASNSLAGLELELRCEGGGYLCRAAQWPQLGLAGRAPGAGDRRGPWETYAPFALPLPVRLRAGLWTRSRTARWALAGSAEPLLLRWRARLHSIEQVANRTVATVDYRLRAAWYRQGAGEEGQQAATLVGSGEARWEVDLGADAPLCFEIAISWHDPRSRSLQETQVEIHERTIHRIEFTTWAVVVGEAEPSVRALIEWLRWVGQAVIAPLCRPGAPPGRER